MSRGRLLRAHLRSPALAAEDRVGADLGERADGGGFVAAVGDVFLEALQGLDVRERAWSIVVVRGEVEEADAVVESEGGVVKAPRLRLMQLRVDGADELLVLGRTLGVDPVANDDLLHCETSLIRSVGVFSHAASS